MNAIMDSSEAHENQMMQLLSNPDKASGFSMLVFDLLKFTFLLAEKIYKRNLW
tara:strand:- start:8006 stop:8164 length:159 start_codon:yes stop_codon:yes gene_type:complete